MHIKQRRMVECERNSPTNTSREEAGLQGVGSCIVEQVFADVSKYRSAFNIEGLSSQTTLRT
jgi:hypothetical protein